MAAPDIVFAVADGSEHRLADFLGHGMVINLWATWCAPCVEEMPSLAALSKALAPDDIAVLPLSSDRGGAARVQAFFQEHGITGLPVLLDPKERGGARVACARHSDEPDHRQAGPRGRAAGGLRRLVHAQGGRDRAQAGRGVGARYPRSSSLSKVFSVRICGSTDGRPCGG